MSTAAATNIGGLAPLAITDVQTATPLAAITLTDPNSAALETVSVTQATVVNGSTVASTSTSFAAGTPDAVQTALRNLVVTPTANLVAPGNTWQLVVTVSDTNAANFQSSSSATITVTSVNDAPTISGTVSGQAIDDTTTIEPFAIATIADPDFGAQDSLTITLSNAANGKLSGAGLMGGTNGVYTMTAASPAALTSAMRALVFTPTANQVAPGDTVTTTFAIAANDGLGGVANDGATRVTAISINDVASITGTTVGAITEGSALPVTGTVSVNDPDVGQSTFAPATTATSTYGVFTFDPATGVWAYTLNNASAAVQALTAGQQVTDTITVTSLDGTATKPITVTITGANGAPAIAGTKPGQTTTDYVAIKPFATATVADTNVGAQDSLTITLSTAANGKLSGAGLTGGTNGVYTIAAESPAALTSALQALIFTPTQHEVAPGSMVTTTFTLTASDGTASTSDNTTSVVATALNYVTGRFLLVGTPGIDVINATGEGNIILGRGGADIINAGSGLAAVSLANGDATVTLGGGLNAVTGGNGNVTVTGALEGWSSVNLGTGNDTVTLGGSHDTILLGNGANMVTAIGGMAFVTTGSGNDTIRIGATGNTIDAGGGTNTIFGGAGADTFVLPAAGKGYDTIAGFSETTHDVLDLRAALSATNWNHRSATLANYLKVTDTSGNTELGIIPTGIGAASTIASLTGASYGLTDLIRSHSLLTG